MKFYKCKECKKIIEVSNLKDEICCGDMMEEVIPGTVDAAREKHIPVVSINGNVVNVVVGSVIHPMTAPHYIEWIAVETNKGSHKAVLSPTDEPKATFILVEGEEVLNTFAYCNLHGLWKA